ncbi:BREX-3 system P-loop-containing protein BrxF [Massilia brevitalea]|uniref:BREX-3 system P-loop-containing protein BrxF n=1 Tax=Massilia brevitalea TaxID=442526 RepID=UPI00273955E0
MVEKLDQMVDEIGALHSKLLLIVGTNHGGKTALIRALATKRSITPLNVSAELAARLAALPPKQRRLQAVSILRELADQRAKGDLLLLDNLEVLFDKTLQLDPLDLLKRHAHSRRVIAIWPGELNNSHLIYANMGHPEHQDYSLDGVVPFEI